MVKQQIEHREIGIKHGNLKVSSMQMLVVVICTLLTILASGLMLLPVLLGP